MLRSLRPLALGLLALLALCVPAASAQSTRTQILRDCEDNGTLDGTYDPSEIRDARNNIPDDVDEYSNCRDVLSRATLSSTSGSGGGSGGSGGGAGGGTGSAGGGGESGSSGGTGSGGGGTGSGGTGATGSAPAAPPAPATPEEQRELDAAALSAGEPRLVDGRRVALTAGAGSNGVPTSMLAVLILLAATVLAAAIPALRRRVLARRQG